MAKITKKEAAGVLGVSERSVENYVSKGQLAVEYRPGKTRPVAVFDQQEVLRLKARMGQEAAAEFAQGLQRKGETLKAIQLSEFRETLAASLRDALAPVAAELVARRPASTPQDLAAKLTLPLAEAAVLAGLSKSFLRAEIAAGRLKAAKRGRGWNVKRADLEAWVRKL